MDTGLCHVQVTNTSPPQSSSFPHKSHLLSSLFLIPFYHIVSSFSFMNRAFFIYNYDCAMCVYPNIISTCTVLLSTFPSSLVHVPALLFIFMAFYSLLFALLLPSLFQFCSVGEDECDVICSRPPVSVVACSWSQRSCSESVHVCYSAGAVCTCITGCNTLVVHVSADDTVLYVYRLSYHDCM